ncbi:metallophosphoesterase family protein [Merdibacter massiliensis]|uniref:metallophosphoesterase family protein n=1 Tax=Merdibacter massiliensis TaxID=1871030 RepID=UPI00096A4C83|nr:metallophosphoesterase family protein [Merdibacter massiliensis]
MIYVLSDIHGMYQKYREMLQLIQFNDEDTLYILGDVIDRGNDGMKILLDMMMRENVIPLIGNHEWMAIQCLTWIQQEITDDFLESLKDSHILSLSLWLHNGAITSIQEWKGLDDEQRKAIVDYLMDFIPYKTINVGNRKFLLVHAGLPDKKEDLQLDDQKLEDLVWTRPDFEKEYHFTEDCTLIVGHTPTFLIHGNPEIFHGKGIIGIDCGAVYPNGKLACLCLDTMKEYYV